MKTKLAIYAVGAMLMSLCATSCNEDDSSTPPDLSDAVQNSVIVNSFSLMANDSVMADLDSVFFSIDLDRATIFNADSLPKGTRVNRLQVSIGLPSVSKAEITMPNDQGVDTVVNYLYNSTDSINFSRGYVTLHLESANGNVTRDYKIYVNVHNMEPNAMAWGDLTSQMLPTSLSSIDAQRTVEFDGEVLCFTQSGSSFCCATTANPAIGTWTKTTVSLPINARLETLTAGDTKLYVIDSVNALYESSDRGQSWTSTGASMSYIYGAIADTAIGVRNASGSYTYTTYPATTETAVPANAPVEATSPAIIYSTEWSESQLMIVAGGRTASGSLTGSVWAYSDGQWVELSEAALPAMEGSMIVPYFAFKNLKTWKVTKNSVLLAFGGRVDGGISNTTVYMSYDYGVHWTEAAEEMQIPSNIEVGIGAQAIVANKQLPSRAITAITEWDCPYIYVFGGVNQSGALNNRILRGVINRLTFKPLQ